MIAIVDAGPLYAVIDDDDRNHDRCLALLQRTDLDLIIPALVIAEVTYLVGTRLGARAEARFLRSLTRFEVEAPGFDDWQSIGALVERYADFPLGGTDASVAVLAERLKAEAVITLDRRHFGALRMRDGRPFNLLPD